MKKGLFPETELNNATFELETQMFSDLYARVLEVISLLKNASNLQVVPQSLTLEGMDGTGKTTLALALATQMRKKGKNALVMRGSGTTGTQDILNWTQRNLGRDGNKSQIIADLKQVMQLQALYAQEQHPSKKIQVAVQMQKLMFDLQNKYASLGYFILSDRGVLSACLGARERAQNVAQFQQLFSFFDYLPIGPTVFIDLPIEEAMRRLAGKAELPDQKDLALKAASYAVLQSNLDALLSRIALTSADFISVDGSVSPKKLQKNVAKYANTL